MLNVVVIVLLSVDPAIETFFTPFGACVLLQPGTYFEEFDLNWSLMTWVFLWTCVFLFSIVVTMEWKEVISTSLRTSSEIGTFPVVAICLTKPIRLHNLFHHDDFSRSIWARLNSGCLFIRAAAVALAITFETTLPRFRTPWKKGCKHSLISVHLNPPDVSTN